MRKLSILLLLIIFVLISTVTLASWNFKAKDAIYSISVDGKGEFIAIGSRDDYVYLLSKDGNKLWEFKVGGTVNSVSISPDGGYIVVGSEDRYVYLLDKSGNLIWKVLFQDIISGVGISDGGKYISVSTSSLDRSLYLLDSKGNVLWKRSIGEELHSTSISYDGSTVLCGGKGATVYAFDTGGKPLWNFQANGYIRAISISPDKEYIAVGSEDNNIYLLDINGKEIWHYTVGDYVLSVGCSNDAKVVVGGSRDKNLYILDERGNLISKIGNTQEVWATNVSPDGTFICVGNFEGSFSSATLKEIISAKNLRIRRYIWIGICIGILIAIYILSILFSSTRKEIERRRWGRVTSGVRLFWKYKTMYLFILPTILFLATFNYYPAFSGIYHAFTDWHPGGVTTWVGWENFRQMKYDQYLTVGIKNLLLLLITNIIKTLTMPLLVAELVFHLRSFKAQYWMRVAYVLPIVVPGIVSILLWTMIYDPNIGLLNQLLRSIGLERYTHSWLGEPGIALWSIIFMGIPWVGAFPFLIYYGGLISVPSELFDAAKVDGATSFQRFFNIDLPLLLGQIKLLIVLTYIGTMQDFTTIFIMTGGGPASSTYVPALQLYYSAMRFNKFGYASAIATVLFIVILIGTIINMRYVRSSIEYEA